MDIKSLWNSEEKTAWDSALQNYQQQIKSSNLDVENKLNAMKSQDFQSMTGKDFYAFLRDYAQWKYTDGRIKSNVQKRIEEYYEEHSDEEMKRILDNIFAIDLEDVYLHIENIKRIKGIGVAGASGILSLVFPKHFGTVDRFAVENLKEIYKNDSVCESKLNKINSIDISTYDAVLVIKIYQAKACQLNQKLKTEAFTPRIIDMVLWGARE